MAEAVIAQSEISRPLPIEKRPWCMGLSDEMLCAPASAVCAWIAARYDGCSDAARYISRCAEATAGLQVYSGGVFGRDTRSLPELPGTTLAAGMCEFFCGLETTLIFGDADRSETESRAHADNWKRELPNRSADLVSHVGVDLFQIVDPSDYRGDDLMHRFLALDYICHMAPASNFVGYLMEACGADTVTELRKALFDPSAYSPDFRLAGFFDYVDVIPWPRFEYGARSTRKIILMPGGPETLRLAESLVRVQIDGSVVFVCDEGEMLSKMVSASMQSGARWEFCPLSSLSDETEERLLSEADEVWAIRRPSPAEIAELSHLERRQADVLARALGMETTAEWWDTSGRRTGSIDHDLKRIQRLPRS